MVTYDGLRETCQNLKSVLAKLKPGAYWYYYLLLQLLSKNYLAYSYLFVEIIFYQTRFIYTKQRKGKWISKSSEKTYNG